jgi:hypothetical protein
MKSIKKTIVILLVLTIFAGACAPAPVETPEVIPTPTAIRPQLSQDTLLFSGPGNRSFEAMVPLRAGETVNPIGTYKDFTLVQIDGVGTGFVYKELIDHFPNNLPQFAFEKVPWSPVDINDYFESEITAFTNGSIIMENTQDDGFGWEAGSTSFDSPFRIRMRLSINDPRAGHANIQLIGTPYDSHAEDWWQGLISTELSIDSDGLLSFCIRNGASEDCAYDEASTIEDGQSFILFFEDPQGKVFHLIDEQGNIALTVKTTSLPGLNLPNGLFPEKKFWLGAWVDPGVTLTASSFALETKPSGTWDPNVDSAIYSPVIPKVITEELFMEYEPSENGSTPLWNRGASVIVRQSEDVFISMIETISEWEQPNNVTCSLHQRDGDKWKVVVELNDPTREPCPIASDGNSLFISTNTSLGENSQPEVVRAQKAILGSETSVLTPEWAEEHNFTAWSYRGLGMDVNNKEVLLLNISDDHGYYWSFLDANGQWSRKGVMNFPVQEDGTNLRLAYPNTILQNRSAYIMTVSDIKETNDEYVAYMLDYGTDFHYVFRQLYYAWTPDIASQDPTEWKLLASTEPYGEISNQDVWMAEDGTTHFLWIEESIDGRLEDYLPEVADTQTLWHAVLKDGEVISRTVLMEYDSRGMRPNRARFQSLPDGRLFVFISGYEGAGGVGNRLIELYQDGTHSKAVKINLDEPLDVFQIAGQQNGSNPSNYIDIIGATDWDTSPLYYARIQLGRP